MSTLHVTVTPLDIAGGRPGNACDCPIARAISRIADGLVWVSGTRVTVGGRSGPLPKEAVRFIKAFDSGECVDPIDFELKVRP